MSKILIVCTGFKSNLFSSLELANRLRDADHDVVFAAQDSSAKWIDHAGFARVSIPHAQTSALAAYDEPFENQQRTKEEHQKRAQKAASTITDEGFANVLSETAPDVVLSDCEHHAAIIQTVAKGVPLGLLAFMFLTPPSKTAPPLNSAIVPGKGWRGSRLGVIVKWLQLQSEMTKKIRKNEQKFWGADYISAHRALAENLGVDLNEITTNQAFQRPWSYLLPTLYLLPQEADLPTKLRPNHLYAGPMVQTDRLTTGDASLCNDFVNSAQQKVFISFGTMRRPPSQFLEKLLTIARNRTDWQFLVATAEHETVQTLGPPDNLTVVDWAPQLEMLRAADCAIFHGGAGTLNECIVTRTPMIIFPYALDGGGNAARIVHNQLGKKAAFTGSATQIEADIDDVLSNPIYKNTLNSVGDALSRYDGVAEDFVRSLAKPN